MMHSSFCPASDSRVLSGVWRTLHLPAQLVFEPIDSIVSCPGYASQILGGWKAPPCDKEGCGASWEDSLLGHDVSLEHAATVGGNVIANLMVPCSQYSRSTIYMIWVIMSGHAWNRSGAPHLLATCSYRGLLCRALVGDFKYRGIYVEIQYLFICLDVCICLLVHASVCLFCVMRLRDAHLTLVVVIRGAFWRFHIDICYSCNRSEACD